MSEEVEESPDSEEEDLVVEEVSDVVVLPIGIEKDGTRYRTVVVDELGGVDEALLADKKKTGNNPAKGLTLVLCRSIQEIEGLVSRKRKPESMVDRSLVRNMYQVDRDFLFSRIQMLTGNDETQLRGQCPKCKTMLEQDCLVSERVVTPWPDGKECTVTFKLPRGYMEVPKKGEPIMHHAGVIRFPRGKDQEAAAPLAANNTAHALTAMLAACILKLGTLESIDQTVTGKLKSRDRKYLFRHLRDELPGMKGWEEIDCWNCGYKVEIVIDVSSFFG